MPVSDPAARPLTGVPFLVIAGLLWGTGGLLGRMLSDVSGMSSTAAATFRLGIGGTLIGVYLLITGRRVPSCVPAWRRVVTTGVLAALSQGCYFAAVSMTTVSTATLVMIGTTPVVVLVVERLAGRRRLGLRSLIATVSGVVGLGLLIGVPTPSQGNVVEGAILAAVAGSVFAAMTLISAQPVAGLDAPTLTGTAFMLGGVLLIPVALLGGTTGLGFLVTPASIGLMLALAVLPTALAYSAYFRGLRSSPAGVGALIALLEPLTAAVLAALLLGDHLGLPGVAGAALLATAVILGSSS